MQKISTEKKLQLDLLQFKAKGHDQFIDFLKGFAIVGVVLLHNLGHTAANRYGFFCLWIGQAVPLFILVQAINTYRSYLDTDKISFSAYFKVRSMKVISRVLRPFLLLQVVIALLFFLLLEGDFNSLVKAFIRGAGLGPGSYYPWIYLQIFILLPVVIFLFKKIGSVKTFIVMGGCQIALEFLCSYLSLTEDAYRVFAVRYVFLTICGIYVMEKGFRLNKKWVILSLVGVFFILLDSFTSISFFPLAYKSLGFPGQHWIAYFYTSILLIYVFKIIHIRLSSNMFSRMIEFFGKESYNIFLIQMLVFWIMRTNGWVSYNTSLKTICFVLVSTFLSLFFSFVKFCIAEKKNKMEKCSRV